MAPIKGSKKSASSAGQQESTRRTMLVRKGLASKVMFYHSVEDACAKAGINDV